MRPAFTAYVRDITDRQRAENELIASRARLVTASDAARQRITRDLHDGAQQHLVATLINLQLAQERWESAPDRARELLGQALRDTRRGIADLRELAAGLHPAVLTRHGLAVAVRALADRVPIPVEIDMPAAGPYARRGQPVFLLFRGADQYRQARAGDPGLDTAGSRS